MQEILSKFGKIYLTGYGGIGKSQLAKEFCYIHEREYDLIWWFDLRGNIELQYENLLSHLSNHEKFNKLLHINIKNLAPSAVADFTNSLLSQCKCKWLLVYDNALNNDIKLPKTKTVWQHIIITAREKPSFKDNILTLGLFTNHESEQFLFKAHPREKKEEITKLYNTLHNYPLALAQTSEEILMYKEGVSTYLKKHNKIGEKKLISIHSGFAQEYNNDYRDVLSHTLQDIEQKDKEAAKILYMLALLKTDFTKKLLKNLLGDKLERNLIILSKYGFLQITEHGNSQILSIHDVIRDMAIEKFNSKNKTYKKEIIFALSQYFNKFYSENNFQYIVDLDSTNDQVAPLYAFIDAALQNDVVDDGVIDAVIISLKLSDATIFKHGDYILYQQIANRVYSKNLDNITPVKKALLYANLVFSDFIYESEENFLKYEKELLYLLGIVEKDKNYKVIFFIYTYLSQMYLLAGDLKESKSYLEKAKRDIDYSDEIYSLLQYWFINLRLSHELRDINGGLKASEVYDKLINQLSPNKINRFASRSLKIRLKILAGRKDEAKKELEETIKSATIYYNNTTCKMLGYLEFTKALLCFQNNQYDIAYVHGHRSLNILNKALGSDTVSSIYVEAHLMFGKIYEKKGASSLALAEYKKCLKFYGGNLYGRVNSFYEYGELLSNLCFLYYKQKNYTESKLYFQKLVANFSLNHSVVERLIKRLPAEYIYVVGHSSR